MELSDKGPDIAENSFLDLSGQLVEILVCQHQVEPVLSGLRENRGEDRCGQILAFINIEVEISPRLFRLINPLEGGQKHLGHQQGPEQSRLVFPEIAFGQIGQEDPAIVHDIRHVYETL
jgi:hypothetical protein